VVEQGSYGEGDTLPDTFVTYQILNQAGGSYADNTSTSMISQVQVALYSGDPDVTQSADTIIRSVMRPAGYLREAGRNLPLDPATRLYGYVCTYNYYELED
jgi:hypothetical protein